MSCPMGYTTSAMNTKTSTTTIGVDLGDKNHAICVLSATAKILSESSITNTRESLARLSKKHPGALVVMEVGMQSPWISRYFEELGHRVLVANPRKVRAIYQNDRKCDRKDAAMLAKLARADETLLHPIQHGSERAQRDLLRVKLRDNLVRQRVAGISAVRFTLKSLGIRLRSPNTNGFAKHARLALGDDHPEILATVEPSLLVIDVMTAQIKEFVREIEQLAATEYPETEFLKQIAGVGTITSLAFVLIIGDPTRFRRPRDIGAYLGLVPKRDQSGDTDKQLRISKAGDTYLRKLLVSAAQYVLGPFGPDTDLKRHGLELAARGGARAKKKAVIAVARKLAVLMLAMWKDETLYEPSRKPA
jgi:transposase